MRLPSFLVAFACVAPLATGCSGLIYFPVDVEEPVALDAATPVETTVDGPSGAAPSDLPGPAMRAPRTDSLPLALASDGPFVAVSDGVIYTFDFDDSDSVPDDALAEPPSGADACETAFVPAYAGVPLRTGHRVTPRSVKRGDTWSAYAHRYGTSYETLARLNARSPTRVRAGRDLVAGDLVFVPHPQVSDPFCAV